MFKNKPLAGYLILETLLATALLGLLITSIFPAVNFLLKRHKRSQFDTEASLLLQEGMEVSYNAFLYDWHACSSGSCQVAVKAPSQWILLPGMQTNIAGKFDRTIEILPVCRSVSGEIKECASPAEVDQNSRLVRVTVNWSQATKPVSASLLLIQY